MDELLKEYGEWAKKNEGLIVHAIRELIKQDTPEREKLENLLVEKPPLIPEERYW